MVKRWIIGDPEGGQQADQRLAQEVHSAALARAQRCAFTVIICALSILLGAWSIGAPSSDLQQLARP